MLSLFLLLGLTCQRPADNRAIEFWHFWTDPKSRPVIQKIIAEFERENLRWKVKTTELTWADGYQKIVVAFGAGRPPDLVELGSDWIAEFVAADVLTPLDLDTTDWLHYQAGRYLGRQYAWPWFLDTRTIYVNRSLLQKADQQFPRDWPGLLVACEKISALEGPYYGFAANSNEPHRLYKKFLPFVWSAGGDIVRDGQIKLDQPEVARALEFYQKLVRYGRVETQKNLEDAFCAGQIGFIISGGWLLKRLVDEPPSFVYELHPMVPETAQGTGISFAGGEYLAIPAKSPKKEAALRLLQLLVRPDHCQMLCDSVGFGFPPFSKPSQLSPSRQVLFEQLANSKSTPFHPQWLRIEAIIEAMVEEITLGHVSPGEAIAKAQRRIDDLAVR